MKAYTIFCLYKHAGGPGSSVGIATDYRLDGPRYNPGGVRFFAHVQTGTGAHPASCTMGTGSFPGVKQPGRGADHPPPSSAEVKKRGTILFTNMQGMIYMRKLGAEG
jgi:hypothetical protein